MTKLVSVRYTIIYHLLSDLWSQFIYNFTLTLDRRYQIIIQILVPATNHQTGGMI